MTEPMTTLFTGAAGFLGERLYLPFVEAGHRVVLSDIAPISSRHPTSCGDLADPVYVQDLMGGIDWLVIGHMSPRRNRDLGKTFDAMIKGTANLFEAAAKQGVSRVCLISSVDAVKAHPHDVKRTSGTRPAGVDLYGLAKACQEVVAEHYSRTTGLMVSALRIGYVVDAQQQRDKYGHRLDEFTENMIDREDVGGAALRSFTTGTEDWRIFHVVGSEDHPRFDTKGTWEDLGFMPRCLGPVAAEAKLLGL